MEIDNTIVILAIILFIIIGIFAISQIGGGSESVSNGGSYIASQYAGGGCGR